MKQYEQDYRGKKLPHQLRMGNTFAITYRLFGSIPVSVLKAYQIAYKAELAALEEQYKDKNQIELEDEIHLLQAKTYLKYDKYLDKNANGPYHLERDAIAQIVVDSLFFLEKNYGEIQAYCIMSNHVHLLFKSHFVENEESANKEETRFTMTHFMERHKGYTALLANRVLQKNKDAHFWQEESYDHRIRNEKSFYRNLRYILQNPVKAGLVTHWRDWKFSYCNPALVDVL
jgi:putative transposase